MDEIFILAALCQYSFRLTKASTEVSCGIVRPEDIVTYPAKAEVDVNQAGEVGRDLGEILVPQ